MSFFINCTHSNGYRETVDECGTQQEAEDEMAGYQAAYPEHSFSIGTEPCGDWLV